MRCSLTIKCAAAAIAVVSCGGYGTPSTGPVAPESPERDAPLGAAAAVNSAASSASVATADAELVSSALTDQVNELAELLRGRGEGALFQFFPIGLEQGQCAVPEAVGLSVQRPGGEPTQLALTDCPRVLEATHQRLATPLVQVPLRVAVSPVGVSTDERSIYSLAAVCAEFEEPCSSDSVSVRWAVMSAVGPIVSLSASVGEALAGGPPYGGETWHTFDVRTGASAALDALLDTASLLKALRDEPSFRSQLSAAAVQELERAKDPHSLLQVVERETALRFGPFGGHAFVESPDDQGLVPLLLGFEAVPAGFDYRRLKQVMLWVQPRAAALRWFAAAERGEGRLLPMK